MAQYRFAALPMKAPGEKKDYSFLWQKEMDKGGDWITTSEWAVLELPGATPVPAMVSASPAPSFDSKSATVWLEGGVSGKTYEVVNTVTTDQGRIHQGSATLQVREAGGA